MENIAVVKVTELKSFLNEIRLLKKELKELQEQENLKSYSVQQTAKLIGVSYNTVRKLIQESKLIANYINDKKEKGKCIIPAWSIKEYLSNKKEK